MSDQNILCPTCDKEVLYTESVYFDRSGNIYHKKCYENSRNELAKFLDNVDIGMSVASISSPFNKLHVQKQEE